MTGEEVQSSKTDTAKEVAFILNKQEHWFALRRIGREWFDLNSCLKTPRHYTDGDVRFHISDAVKQGYTVFAVPGQRLDSGATSAPASAGGAGGGASDAAAIR